MKFRARKCSESIASRRRTLTPERRRKSSNHSLSKNSSRSLTKTQLKLNYHSKTKLDPHRKTSIPSLKVKLKNKSQGTKEFYPVVVSNQNQTDKPRPSNAKRSSLKIKMRRQLWNWSKPVIRDNNRWSDLMKENNIDIDKINIDKVDLSLINVDALGIENRLLKRAVVWLLK